MPDDLEPAKPSATADDGQPKEVGVLRLKLSAVNLGPDYPPSAVSAEIGRVTIAAARVDQEYALLLYALHAGRRADWDLAQLSTWHSGRLHDKALRRVKEFFDGPLLEQARAVLQDAYAALDRRHGVMHTVWTLTGRDAMTDVPDLVAALESPDPDAALAELTGRDVDSDGWRTTHPRTGGPGPDSVVDLRAIRGELERAQSRLTGLRFRLASALYSGEPPGARRVVNPDTGEELDPS